MVDISAKMVELRVLVGGMPGPDQPEEREHSRDRRRLRSQGSLGLPGDGWKSGEFVCCIYCNQLIGIPRYEMDSLRAHQSCFSTA